MQQLSDLISALPSCPPFYQPPFLATHILTNTHTKTHTNGEGVALCKRCDARAKGHTLAYINTRHSIDFLYCTSRLMYPA